MTPRPEKEKNRWRPSASLEAIKLRAESLARIRRYFAAEGVLEVETPLMVSGTIPDPHIPSFSINLPRASNSQNKTCRYLSSSPEFAMKRLLAAGSGSIYQVCKAFRQGEQGRMHNPEFTLLEWYRTGFDHHRLMDDVGALIAHLADGLRDFEGEERLSYRSAFQHYLGLDPFAASSEDLMTCSQDYGIGTVVGLDEADRDSWLDLLMGQCIQPRLGKNRLTFIFDYPASQAALARIRKDTPPVAERFELFIDGVELANGFNELRNAEEQRRRFEQDLQRRKEWDQELVSLDSFFLDALEAGLPECAGVALGLDRLLLVINRGAQLEEMITFPFDRV